MSFAISVWVYVVSSFVIGFVRSFDFDVCICLVRYVVLAFVSSVLRSFFLHAVCHSFRALVSSFVISVWFCSCGIYGFRSFG